MKERREKMVELVEVCQISGARSFGKPHDVALEEIAELTRSFGFSEIHPVHTSEIVTARWVGLKCRYGCAKYNTSWCCPPAAPDFETVNQLLSEYELALLLLRQNRNQHFYRNSNEKRRCQLKQWKATIALERKLFLMGYYKAFGFPADTCALCKECAYPKLCKFPNEKRPSLEACSIDVLETLKRLGRSVTLAGHVDDPYSSWSMILLE